MSLPERDLNPPEKREFTDDELREARDEIIECVLAHGEWPYSPKRVGWSEFSLYHFLMDRVPTEELLEFLILALSDHGIAGRFADKRNDWEKCITEWLIAYFDDTERGRRIVEDRAEEIEREEREDH